MMIAHTGALPLEELVPALPVISPGLRRRARE
jgi:hypothetical protein